MERVLAVPEHVPPRREKRPLPACRRLFVRATWPEEATAIPRNTTPISRHPGVAMRTALVILVVLGLAAGGAADYSTHLGADPANFPRSLSSGASALHD